MKVADKMDFEKWGNLMADPHCKTYVCAITEKISRVFVKIGEAWISKDGIKKLIQYMDQ